MANEGKRVLEELITKFLLLQGKLAQGIEQTTLLVENTFKDLYKCDDDPMKILNDKITSIYTKKNVTNKNIEVELEIDTLEKELFLERYGADSLKMFLSNRISLRKEAEKMFSDAQARRAGSDGPMKAETYSLEVFFAKIIPHLEVFLQVFKLIKLSIDVYSKHFGKSDDNPMRAEKEDMLKNAEEKEDEISCMNDFDAVINMMEQEGKTKKEIQSFFGKEIRQLQSVYQSGFSQLEVIAKYLAAVNQEEQLKLELLGGDTTYQEFRKKALEYNEKVLRSKES